MSKKILIISGSPRKGGNSDILCSQFADGAIESGNIVETIHINDEQIGSCLACDNCKKHNGCCVLKDDMAELLDGMIKADVIVLATPVYFYSISGQLKTFIDRTYARFTEIMNKEFYLIMTAAEASRDTMKCTLECLRGFLECLPGAKERGVVYGNGAWGLGQIMGMPAMTEAYEFGKNV